MSCQNREHKIFEAFCQGTILETLSTKSCLAFYKTISRAHDNLLANKLARIPKSHNYEYDTTSKASLSHSSNKGVKHCQTGINLDVCHSNDSMQRLHQSKLQSRCMTQSCSNQRCNQKHGPFFRIQCTGGFGFRHVWDHSQIRWFDHLLCRHSGSTGAMFYPPAISELRLLWDCCLTTCFTSP